LRFDGDSGADGTPADTEITEIVGRVRHASDTALD